MLEKPNLQDQEIIACLRDEYSLHITQFAFLPLGGDLSTALYRAEAFDGTAYFIKLRRGEFDELIVELPSFLAAQGISQIIPPRRTKTGELRANFGEYKLIVFPFVEGISAYETKLSEEQWAEFGAAFQQIHSAALPPALLKHIRRETYSPEWHQDVKKIMTEVEEDAFDDPIAQDGAAFLHSKRAEVLNLIARAEQLAVQVQTRAPEFVLCHGDIHAGNLHVNPGGAVYIVDWDYPILAPREYDLMFIGGGQGFVASSAEEEERLFFRGYGQTGIDLTALVYYRYERSIKDIVVESERVFSKTLGKDERAQSLTYLKWGWLPGFAIERAIKAGEMLGNL